MARKKKAPAEPQPEVAEAIPITIEQAAAENAIAEAQADKELALDAIIVKSPQTDAAPPARVLNFLFTYLELAIQQPGVKRSEEPGEVTYEVEYNDLAISYVVMHNAKEVLVFSPESRKAKPVLDVLRRGEDEEMRQYIFTYEPGRWIEWLGV